MEQHPKQLFSATIVFFEGAENDYEVTISARKITSKNDVLAKSSAVIDIPKKKVNVQHPQPKKKTNPQPKNNVLTSSGRNDRSCKGGCRCVSFYNLPRFATKDDIVRLCSDFGFVVESVESMWNHPKKKSLFVWMATQKQANDIVREYDGRTLDNYTLRVIKGHFSKANEARSGPKINEDHAKRVKRFGFTPKMQRGTKLDRELYPARKEKSDRFSKERVEKLNNEIDEYMREKEGDEELDNEIDEYLHMKITTRGEKKESKEPPEYLKECEDCGKCFESEQSFIKHLDFQHLNFFGQPNQCKKGSNMFSKERLNILDRDERKNKEDARKLLISSSESSESESEEELPKLKIPINSLGEALPTKYYHQVL